MEDIYQADFPGLILGATATIFNRGKHSLQVGVEYAPAFKPSGAISNVGFTIGYQFFSRPVEAVECAACDARY